MQRAKKKRGGLDNEKLTQEFTSGQLVIGTCTAILVMCFCFLAGMAVERYQSTGAIAYKEISNQPTMTPEASAAAATQRDRGTSRSLSSTRSPSGTRRAEDGDVEPKDTAPTVTPVELAKSALGSGPRRTELPPLPPAKDKAPENPALKLTRDTPPSPVEKNVAKKTPPTPSADVEATTSVAAKSEERVIEKKELVVEPPPILPNTQVAKKETSEPPTPPTKPQAERAPPPKTTPKASQEAEPAKQIERGIYGIQVASLQGARRQVDSTEYLSRLAKGGYNAEVFPSEDGRYYRVVIVGYNDRTSAVAGCKVLRKKAAFYDAWVVKLP